MLEQNRESSCVGAREQLGGATSRGEFGESSPGRAREATRCSVRSGGIMQWIHNRRPSLLHRESHRVGVLGTGGTSASVLRLSRDEKNAPLRPRLHGRIKQGVSKTVIQLIRTGPSPADKPERSGSQYLLSISTTSNPSVSLYSDNAALFVFRTCKLTYAAPNVVFIARSARPKASAPSAAPPSSLRLTRHLHQLVRQPKPSVVPQY